jgi:hypothetical protein
MPCGSTWKNVCPALQPVNGLLCATRRRGLGRARSRRGRAWRGPIGGRDPPPASRIRSRDRSPVESEALPPSSSPLPVVQFPAAGRSYGPGTGTLTATSGRVSPGPCTVCAGWSLRPWRCPTADFFCLGPRSDLLAVLPRDPRRCLVSRPARWAFLLAGLRGASAAARRRSPLRRAQGAMRAP